jgi:hypothetical protein
MSTATAAAPSATTRPGLRRGWARMWAVDRADRRPTAALAVRWQLLDAPDGVALDDVRVRAGRVPGAWSDAATVRPSADGSVAVELRLPVEVWAAPAVLDFTVRLLDPAARRSGRTFSLTTSEPFFWNGTDAAVDIELYAHAHSDGTLEPRISDVLVHL